MDSKLQRSEIHLDDEQTIVIAPVHPGREMIRVSVGSTLQRRYLFIKPEEAYILGDALKEHALECGFEPDEC